MECFNRDRSLYASRTCVCPIAPSRTAPTYCHGYALSLTVILPALDNTMFICYTLPRQNSTECSYAPSFSEQDERGIRNGIIIFAKAVGCGGNQPNDEIERLLGCGLLRWESTAFCPPTTRNLNVKGHSIRWATSIDRGHGE